MTVFAIDVGRLWMFPRDRVRDLALSKCRDRLPASHLAEGYDSRTQVCRRCWFEAWFTLNPRP